MSSASLRSPDTGNHGPLVPDLLLSEFLNVPLLPIDRPRQHSGDLVDNKHAGRHTAQAAGNVEARPLDPLDEVVGEQHDLEQAGLRDAVVLVNAAHGCALLPGQALLAAQLAAADLAQLVVVEVIGRQADVEDGNARGELQRREGGELGVPGAPCDGTVGSQPAADAGGVEELEDDGEGPDQGVDGRHGGLDPGEDDGAIDVVHDEEGGEDLVLPREIGDSMLRWEGVHDVQQGHEARALHGHPRDAARQVECAVGGRLAHAVP